MADRILEIKSLLERISAELVLELQTQRREIEELKKRVEDLESGHQGAAVSQVPAEHYTEQNEDDKPLYDDSESLPDKDYIQEDDDVIDENYGSGEDKAIEDTYAQDDDQMTVFTVTDLNDIHSAPKTTVSDLFAERNTIADVAQSKTIPWMVDIPGPKVEMIQSALTFNDRLTFIRELFEGDSEQFNITLDRINETSTFEEVVSDMRDAYPEWDENSPIVYRFYMEVRRRFRD
jgi:hypothetical protein